MPRFVPRQRKHKVLAREEAQKKGGLTAAASPPAQPDANVLEIVPDTRTAVAEARKAQLERQLKDGSKTQVGGKKAKRLEKYIENKLRKDENRELLAKLAQTKIDTSLFSSTRTLGQGRETKKQSLSRAFGETGAAINQGGNDGLLFARRGASYSSDDESIGDADSLHGQDSVGNQDSVAVQAKPVARGPQEIGSGLKRPLGRDDEGRPVIHKRQKRGGIRSKVSFQPAGSSGSHAIEGEEGEDDEWNGFSSDNGSVETDDGDSENEPSDESPGHASDDVSENNETDESGEGDSEDISEVEAGNDHGEGEKRSSAFKVWAHQRRNEALGYQSAPAEPVMLDIPKPLGFRPRPPEEDPLPAELKISDADRKAFSVPVTRLPDIQDARLRLPIVAEEQKIMECIHNNHVVVICGATGSGKTTQVPQFLFEAGYGSKDSPTPGLIGVTQPRKVAAVSMAKRVGQEVGEHSSRVAYQIRFEGTVDEVTAVKFMTDGVLLREAADDISLSKYSAIIVDEAHERSVNTDILIGMLSRVVKLRTELAREDPAVQPLKLIIMSATLRIDDMTKNPTLFPSPPPVLDIEGRQYPVAVHFARQTRHDYVEEAFKKIARGHRRLPAGGFLVFLTGHDEISRLSKKLKQSQGSVSSAAYPKAHISANDAPLEVEDIEFGEDAGPTDGGNHVEFHDEDDEDDDAEFDVPDEGAGTSALKMHILPLFSLLPTREQLRVFEPPPAGYRQIILATNIAETSLTIPDIRYVFDCGRSKERRYDRDTGVQSYEVGWINKASANQRSGRAGRTGPGHAYRLYSSAVYERDFPEFAEPEILRMPIEGVVLQLKAMRLQHVVNFPFPTPPDRQSIAHAEKLLQYLSAVNADGQATQMGATMARFPLPPRFARILLIGHLHDCLPYAIALVAGLSVAEIFVPENQAIPAAAEPAEPAFRSHGDVLAESRQAQLRQRYERAHQAFGALDDASDAMRLLQVVGEFAHEPTERWCEERFVRFGALRETQKLRRQLAGLLQKHVPAFAGLAGLAVRDRLDRPAPRQVAALKQMVAAGFVDQVAVRADLAAAPPPPPPPSATARKPRRAIDVPYLPLRPIDDLRRGDGGDDDDERRKAVYIHPSSLLARLSPQECPDYVVYSHLQRAAAAAAADTATARRPRTRMLALTDVTGAQLAALAKGTPLLRYGKPLKEARTGAATRDCWVVPYLRADGGAGPGYPLPVTRVAQRRVSGKGWVVV